MRSKALDYILLLKLAIPLLVLLLLISYQFAFKKTWGSYQEYTLLKVLETSAENLSVSPAYTASRIKKVNELYGRFGVDSLTWKHTLWNSGTLLSQKYNCMIHAFPPVKMVFFNGQQFYKQSISFAGEYGSLLKLLHELSYRKNMGVLSGIRYVKKTREQQLLLNAELLALSGNDN